MLCQIEATKYCATFGEFFLSNNYVVIFIRYFLDAKETGGATGYFAMEIDNGQGKYSYDIDLTNFATSVPSCDVLQPNGWNYHIHTYWLDSSVASSSTTCGSDGGHFDPNFACSGSTEETVACTQLNRAASSGYTYVCSPSVYNSGNYAACERGDLSGKMGPMIAYGSKGKKFQSNGVLYDNIPPYEISYLQSSLNTKPWSTVILHCGQTTTRVVCAKFSTIDTISCRSAFNDFTVSSINVAVTNNDDSQEKSVSYSGAIVLSIFFCVGAGLIIGAVGGKYYFSRK